jgi:uncharacterized repeat protein (TIGR03803 family)
MTTIGGEGYDALSGYGTVFMITPAGSFTTIHSFAGSDGSVPQGELTKGNDGNFYGTTSQGGASFNAATFQSGYGSVFKITPAGAVTTLHSFAGSAGNDGSLPYGGPIQASDGSFYGTTEGGGPSYVGVAYHILAPIVDPPSVVSRKVHGNGAGTFDIILPLSGNPGIECRAPGDSSVGTVDYKLVFSFPEALNSVGSVGASATGTTQPGAASGSIDPTDAHKYIVNLTGLPNAQYITVTLNDVHDVANHAGNAGVTFGLLVGDVNGSARVDSGDVFLTRQQTLQDANVFNFRNDVNASGRIDSGDVFLTRQQTLTALP